MRPFLQYKFPLLIGIVGALFVLNAFLELITPVEIFAVRHSTDYVRLAIGLVVVTIASILYRNVPVADHGGRHFPNFRGEWLYAVETADGTYRHKGDCIVKQDRDVLSISGTRRHSSMIQDGKLVEKEINIHWSTSWCELCSDGKIRFDYGIDLTDGHRMGHCIIDFPSSKVDQMSGHYYQLPTRRDQADLVCGTISFQRKEKERGRRSDRDESGADSGPDSRIG